MLELHERRGALRRIEDWLRERGFFAPGGEELVADLYLGYGLSAAIRRTATPAPPEPCPLPLAACVVRADEGRSDGATQGSVRGGALVAHVERGRLPSRGGRGARRHRQGRRVPGEHRAAPRRALPGPPARSRRLPRLADPAEGLAPRRRGLAHARGAGLGDRLGLARALPRTSRGQGLDDADQGHTPGRLGCGAPRLREGRRRARHDRRPRAQRPLARLPRRNRAVAAADGHGAARGSRAHGLARRGAAARPTSGSPTCSTRPSPVAPSPARPRSPRSTRSRRWSRSAAARRWARSGACTATATWSSR